MHTTTSLSSIAPGSIGIATSDGEAIEDGSVIGCVACNNVITVLSARGFIN
jgi:hypothetical protein